MAKVDITGKVYGRLTVLQEDGKTNASKIKWLCKCICGKTTTVIGTCLKSGHTESCGCLHSERLLSRNTKHGQGTANNYTVEFSTWRRIKQRCYNAKAPHYKDYGGRGIIMSDEWKNSFTAFFSDMGLRPSSLHSIDRINNDGNYEKGNCKWSTQKEQSRNTRRNRWIEHNGQRKVLEDWAIFLRIPRYKLVAHLKKKSFERIYNIETKQSIQLSLFPDDSFFM